MANSGSFGKRENEKKKQAKRLEKQKRKEERKANSSTGSFEDMIAYVDANGNIIDTPPELIPEEVDPENIVISVPKKEDQGPILFQGRVEYFNAERGYGFIKELNSIKKYFFHTSNAPQDITEGNIVTFDIERGERGINAVNIKIDK
jgi:Cold shock proteins